MKFLPIQFSTKLELADFKDLSQESVLESLESYLLEKGFNYVSRKADRIVFHKANLSNSLDFKSFLSSGVIRVIKENDHIIVTNGNWQVFLIAIPFIVVLLLAHSSRSTFNEFEIRVLWGIFLFIFGGNLIVRIVAHLNFSSRIKSIV